MFYISLLDFQDYAEIFHLSLIKKVVKRLILGNKLCYWLQLTISSSNQNPPLMQDGTHGASTVSTAEKW